MSPLVVAVYNVVVVNTVKSLVGPLQWYNRHQCHYHLLFFPSPEKKKEEKVCTSDVSQHPFSGRRRRRVFLGRGPAARCGADAVTRDRFVVCCTEQVTRALFNGLGFHMTALWAGPDASRPPTLPPPRTPSAYSATRLLSHNSASVTGEGLFYQRKRNPFKCVCVCVCVFRCH